MSWKQVDNTGASDLDLYKTFVEKFVNDEVIDAVLDGKYKGDDRNTIEEKISADMSQIGLVFDPEDLELNSQRYRAMRIRDHLDKQFRPECITTDMTWDSLPEMLLTPEELKQYKLQLAEEKEREKEKAEDDEDENDKIAVLRPFCLYAVDTEHLYAKKLDALPTDPVTFAKLAFNHEVDCIYEDEANDEEYEDYEDIDDIEEEDDLEEEEEEEEDVEDVGEEKEKHEAGAGAKSKSDKEDKCCDHDHDHVHGHDQDQDDFDYDDLEDAFPYEDEEIKLLPIEDGFKLLGTHADKFKALFTKACGVEPQDLKYYSMPGKHYIVGWIDFFGIFGLRLNEILTATEDVYETDDEDEEGGDEE